MKQIKINLKAEETSINEDNNSNIVKVVYSKALYHYNKSNYKQAEAILYTIFQHAAKNSNVNYLMALCLMRLYDDSKRNINKSIKHLKNVLILNEKDSSTKISHTLLLLAYLHLKINAYAIAREYLNQLMTRDNHFQKAQVFTLYGYLFYMQKKYSEAEYYYKQSLEIEPNNPNTHNSLGYLYLHQSKNMEEAFKHISAALKNNQQHYAYLDSLGWYYVLKSNFSRALVYLTQSLKEKWHAITQKHIDYVKINCNFHRTKSALVMINNIVFLIGLPFLLVNCSNAPYKKAYREAVSFNSREEYKTINKAIKKYNDVIRYTLYAIEGKFEAHKAMGIKLLQSEMYLEAAKSFEQAKLLKPTDSNLHYYLGLSYANYSRLALQNKEKYLKLAEDAYQIGLNLNAKNTIIYYALGVLNGFIKGELDRGIEYLEVAKKQEPMDVNTLFALANLYFQKGNLSQAKELYQSITKITPEKSAKWLKAKQNIEQMSSKLILDDL